MIVLHTKMKDISIIKAKGLPTTMRIGKSGLNEGVINELQLQLKRKKMVKVKILKPAFEHLTKAELKKMLEDKTNSTIIHSIGNVFVLKHKLFIDRNRGRTI
ncbi:YhbY family RNA-binding protein [Candidatus Woesearchaeota archaeon]|nr:YhbY family RNA-binding protein [Candidatus Woesearchaeota archaeon]